MLGLGPNQTGPLQFLGPILLFCLGYPGFVVSLFSYVCRGIVLLCMAAMRPQVRELAPTMLDNCYALTPDLRLRWSLIGGGGAGQAFIDIGTVAQSLDRHFFSSLFSFYNGCPAICCAACCLRRGYVYVVMHFF